jgi:hypothetical protein
VRAFFTHLCVIDLFFQVYNEGLVSSPVCGDKSPGPKPVTPSREYSDTDSDKTQSADIQHANIVQSGSVSHDAAEENTDVMSEQVPVAGAADANAKQLAGDTTTVVIEHRVTSDVKVVDKDVADIPADASADLVKNTSPTAVGNEDMVDPSSSYKEGKKS